MIKTPLETNIFNYEYNEHKFFYDLDTGFFAESSELLEDIFKLIPVLRAEEIINKLKTNYPEGKIKEYLQDLCRLHNEEKIFSKDSVKSFKNKEEWINKQGLANLWLNVSHDCNMRCIYCFGHGGSYGGKRELMTREMAKKSIDFWYNRLGNNKKCNVTFFGGEPFINIDVIKWSINYIKELTKGKDLEIYYSITSNGTVFDDELTKFMSENKIHPMISIDGGPKIQNKNRPFISGKGSYGIVKKNIKKLRENFNTLQARITLIKDNAPYFEETVKHLWELGFTDVSFEIVTIDDKTLSLDKDDVKLLNSQISELTDITFQNIIEGRHRFFSNVIKICFQIHNRLVNNICSFQGVSTIMVNPSGEFHKCHRMMDQSDMSIGNIDEGIDWNKYTSTKIKPLDELICKNCIARSICGGGCAHEHWLYNGDFNKPYEIKCICNKYMMNEAFRLYTKLYLESPKILNEFFSKEKKEERV